MIFWKLKRKDNVNYNFEIADGLIKTALKSENRKFFYKPIVLILASVIECTLYDFLKKVNEHRREKIPTITPADSQKIQNMKKIPNKLRAFNDICRKYGFLGAESDIYDKIDAIAEIRNRIHIQNEANNPPIDEFQLWTSATVKDHGRLLKKIYLYVCENYPRPNKFHESPNLSEFPSPWEQL